MSTQSVRYMGTQEAAEYLLSKGVRHTPTTLTTFACRGGGPPFQKDGHRRVYTDLALDEYAAKRLGKPVNSTSELSAANAA